MYTHRDLCKVALSWLITQPGIDLAIDEIKFGRGIADVLGVTTSTKSTNRRIAVIEVKRQRQDLLSDLRARKLLKYERTSTHCYLAATHEAFGNKTNQEILQDLETKGLPKYWGVLLLPISGRAVKVIRGAKRKQPANIRSLRMLIAKIAKSYMYKTLRAAGQPTGRGRRRRRRR